MSGRHCRWLDSGRSVPTAKALFFEFPEFLERELGSQPFGAVVVGVTFDDAHQIAIQGGATGDSRRLDWWAARLTASSVRLPGSHR